MENSGPLQRVEPLGQTMVLNVSGSWLVSSVVVHSATTLSAGWGVDGVLANTLRTQTEKRGSYPFGTQGIYVYIPAANEIPIFQTAGAANHYYEYEVDTDF